MNKMPKRMTLIVATVAMISLLGVVSAWVYEMAQTDVTQTVKDVASLTVQNSAIGDIEEGETRTITSAELSSLGGIVSTTTTKDNVYLYFDSNIDTLGSSFSDYTLTVKYASVGSGSSHSVGDVACTMSIDSPDPSAITLDVAGTWTFDFEIAVTALSVSSDQASTTSIVVTAESS
jgi:Flp pilus assembly protein TadG